MFDRGRLAPLARSLQPGTLRGITLRSIHGFFRTLDRLKEAIRRKRPGLLRRGVVLQHDNATPHSANLSIGPHWKRRDMSWLT
ncbi:histone-lysine N-methyltransferase SETMAR [Plakobranchus ocellatus]|uniref:Histone-lysine N-methyltransferase SETMAR n=1 Tax=Plakobranchus ocellatus TaxID=259542 RepID=A0AAV3ZNE3_9GAST|nr:histone-lysine N-methyltransferase SETMAR [Plakobranchus ocellatus]